MGDFEDEFADRLREEFDAPETVIQDIVAAATRYHENCGIEKTADHYLGWMEKVDYDIVGKWNYAIGMTAGKYWDINLTTEENPYKL